ncbi:MAG: flavin reductase family protein [Planctomycetes bacterium]|nr:flavin reductase family protein [Planctomycetota bacterium]
MEIDPSALDRKSAYLLQISCIIPRPIALVTTLSKEGVVNLAPFSYFNGISSSPPIVMIAVGAKRAGRKDTRRNIEDTGEFVVNVAVPELMDAVIIGAQEHPPHVSELELAKLTPAPSRKVRVPRVQESPINMECVLHKLIDVEETALILGRVVRYHVRDDVLRDGQVDPRRLTFVGRLGADYYARVTNIFEHRRKGRNGPTDTMGG